MSTSSAIKTTPQTNPARPVSGSISPRRGSDAYIKTRKTSRQQREQDDERYHRVPILAFHA
jgi:hypothetical protein